MQAITRSLWLPVGPPNFSTMTGAELLLRETANSPGRRFPQVGRTAASQTTLKRLFSRSFPTVRFPVTCRSGVGPYTRRIIKTYTILPFECTDLSVCG
jgi:hypothetical protein